MGQSLSNPVTTQHIERVNTNFFRSGCIHLNGWRMSQEDGANLQIINEEHNIMLFSVYDGHGGPLASKFMSETAPTVFSQITDLSDTENITRLIVELDDSFLSLLHEDGTTACIVFVQAWDLANDKPYTEQLVTALTFEDRQKIGFKVLACNIGDSRAIIVKPHTVKDPINEDWFVQCTEDHKPQDPVERQRIVQAGGFVQSNRVDGNLALSRAIGDRAYKDNSDLPKEKQKVIPIPDYEEFFIRYGDVLFVACDGIFESAIMDHNTVAGLIYDKIKALQNQILSKIDLEVLIELKRAQPHPDPETGADDSTEHIDINDYSTLPMEVQKYIDQVWDPALISRYLIEQSLCFGSKDNHTAITISFAPYTPPTEKSTKEWETVFHTEIERLMNLPHSDICPGPRYFSAGQQSFEEVYGSDIGQQPEEFMDAVNLVDQAVEDYVINNPDPVSTNRQYEMVPVPINIEELSFPPIVVRNLRSSDQGGVPGIPPQLLQLLLSQQAFGNDDQ